MAKTESSLVSARNGSSLTAFFSNGGFFFTFLLSLRILGRKKVKINFKFEI